MSKVFWYRLVGLEFWVNSLGFWVVTYGFGLGVFGSGCWL